MTKKLINTEQRSLAVGVEEMYKDGFEIRVTLPIKITPIIERCTIIYKAFIVKSKTNMIRNPTKLWEKV